MRYERPVLRDLLGDDALGADCRPGSTASPDCGTGTHPVNCVSGESAESGSCGDGTRPNPNCSQGGFAAFSCGTGDHFYGTCTGGDYAGGTCSTGWSPGGDGCVDGSST